MDLDVALRRWADGFEEIAPAEDPARADGCLSYNEIGALIAARSLADREAAAALLESRREHIGVCRRCRLAVERAAAKLRGQLLDDEETRRSAVYFDAEGTLHLTLEGITERRVRLAVEIDGRSIDLGEAEVVDGSVRIERPLPGLGLRSRAAGRERVAVQAVGD